MWEIVEPPNASVSAFRSGGDNTNLSLILAIKSLDI